MEPFADGSTKAGLWAVHRLSAYVVGGKTLHGLLRHAIAKLERFIDRQAELQEIPVEERNPHLDAVGHRHLVGSHEQQLRKSQLELDEGHLLEKACTR